MNDDIDYNALTDLAGADGHDGPMWYWTDDIDYGIYKAFLKNSAAMRPVYCGLYSPEFYRHYMPLWEPQTIIHPAYYRSCYAFRGTYPPIHRTIVL